MKKWSSDMVKAFKNCEKHEILSLLRLGFPIESCLCIKDEFGGILINKTFCAHLSCEYGFLDILKELISLGCLLETKDSFLRTPLMIACEVGNLEIVKFLALECKVSLKGFDYSGHTIIHISAINSQIHILKFLVEEVSMNVNALSKLKKTALEICKDLYSSNFDYNLERVIAFLIAKNTQRKLALIPEENFVIDKGYHFNCHEKCIERYSQSLNNRVVFRQRFQNHQASVGPSLKIYEKNRKNKKYDMPLAYSADLGIGKNSKFKHLSTSSLIPVKKLVYSKSHPLSSSSSSTVLSVKTSIKTAS